MMLPDARMLPFIFRAEHRQAERTSRGGLTLGHPKTPVEPRNRLPVVCCKTVANFTQLYAGFPLQRDGRE